MHYNLVAATLLSILSAGSVSAQNASDGGPTSKDILLAQAAGIRAVFGNERPLEIIVDGDIVRYVSDSFPLQEEALPERAFCEPFLSFEEQHWHCTYMRKARRIVLGSGMPEEKIARAIEDIAELPFRENRTETVLVADADGYTFALDYVRQLDAGGYEVRSGAHQCARIFEKDAEKGLLYGQCYDVTPEYVTGPENCVQYKGPGSDPKRPWKDLPGLGTNLVVYFYCEVEPALLLDD